MLILVYELIFILVPGEFSLRLNSYTQHYTQNSYSTRPTRVCVCVCECARASRAGTSACCAAVPVGPLCATVRLFQRLCCLRLSTVALLEVVVVVLVPCWGGQAPLWNSNNQGQIRIRPTQVTRQSWEAHTLGRPKHGCRAWGASMSQASMLRTCVPSDWCGQGSRLKVGTC